MIISTQAPRTPRPLRSAPLCLADHLERGPWTSAAAAVPSAEQQQQPPRTIRSGRKTREAPAIGCWNVLEGVIASRQHPRRASEPVSRVVDPPSSSHRRHHPPVESKTSLPLPKNPTVSSQASKRPGARHPCFFSHARSLAHVTWASATLRGSLVLHPVTPQHRPPVRDWLSPRSPCRWRWQLQLSQSTEWFHRARPAVPSRGRFSAGAAPGSMRTRAGGVLCCCPLHWCCSCCLVLPACVLLRAACCVLRALLENTERLVDSTPLLPSSHSSPSPDPPTSLLPPHPTPLLPGCDTLVAASFRG